MTALLSGGFFCAACKYFPYGLDEAFYRKDSVSERADSLTELSADQIMKSFEGENGGTETAKAFSGLLSGTARSVYSFLVITDVHFGGEGLAKNPENRRDDDFFAWLAENDREAGDDDSRRPLFCICLGDVAEHGREEEFSRYREFTQRLEKLGLKTFTAVGNHDLYNSGWEHYTKYVYPYTSFYRFKTRLFNYYFIDSASGSLGDAQYAKLVRALKNDSSPKIVCSHYPLYAEGHFFYVMNDSTERNLLISACAKDDVRAFISGHAHMRSRTDFGSFAEEGIPGFLERNSWALVTVDERNESVSCEIISGASE